MWGMTGDRDYLYICIPLTAGVLLALWISEQLIRTYDAAYFAAGLTFALCGTGAMAAAGNKFLRTSAPFWIATFFCCGALCLFEDRLLLLDLKQSINALFARAQSNVCVTIDAIPFSDTEHNALVKALVTGDRSSLSSGTKSAFRNAGAAHMLALSGMHLGIIYLMINRSLLIIGNRPWARKTRNILTICLTGLYTILCGAGPSLLRAWLFIALYESGKLWGRPQNAGRVLCAALTIHLIFRPSDIAEPGFQLSYLAMAGIVLLWPRMRSWYKTEGTARKKWQGGTLGQKIWDLMALSISCQLFTGPLSYLYFHNFPKYFLVTNLIGAPLLTIVLFCAIASLTLTAMNVPPCILYSWLEMPIHALIKFMEIFA